MLWALLMLAALEEFSEMADGRMYSVKGVLQQGRVQEPQSGTRKKVNRLVGCMLGTPGIGKMDEFPEKVYISHFTFLFALLVCFLMSLSNT